MSQISETDLDLEKLFLPAWAQEKPAPGRYEKFSGGEEQQPRRAGRRDDFLGKRRERPARPGKRSGDKMAFRRGERRERPAPPPPLPEIGVAFVADEKGVEHLARQVRMTGRAYPLFQIAQLVLQKPERYSVELSVKKKSDGAVAQRLFVCALDDTPWLSEDDAVAHALKNHFATFYQTERTATEPPKGIYTFVAQCGMSGVILGPPNHHDYQNQLRKLHAGRFSRMPFEAFKSRVKIVKDEAVVKKWIEEQSFKTEYVVLNVPEPVRLASLEAVEKHFRAVHKDNIVRPVEAQTVGGAASRNLRSRDLQRLVRAEWERQRHFPLQLATALSKQFAAHGLQFFKVNKTVVHVGVARPQYLDLDTTPVSENVRRIMGFIHANPKCSRRQLIETLAPSPTQTPASPPARPGEAPGPDSRAPAESAGPTPEQTALIADLHWLVHQGHVLEFADGHLEAARKPAAKPARAEQKITGEKPAEHRAAIAGPAPAVHASVEAGAGPVGRSDLPAPEAPPPAEMPSAAEIPPAF